MAHYTIESLADELDTSPEQIVEFLKEIGIQDLNGWEPDWTLHDSEVENCQAHWEKEETDG